MRADGPSGSAESYFAAVAETYDRLQPVIAGPGYQAGLTFAVDLVPHDEHDAFVCLELGCGTATLTHDVLGRFPKARVIALDGEPAMLDVARAKLSPYAHRVEVRQADVLTCKLPPCDLVLSSFVFHHVPPGEMQPLLRRVTRALAPGGCLILLDQMTAGPPWGEHVGGQSRRLSRRHVADAIAAGRATQPEIDARWALKRKAKQEGRDVEYRHSAERISQAMSAAGFSEVGLVWRMFANTILVGFVPETGPAADALRT